VGCTPPTIFAIYTEYRSFSTIAIPTVKTARDVLVRKESVSETPVTVNGSGIMKQFQMKKRVTTLSVLASLGLLAACGSDSGKAVGSGGASSMGGATGTGGTSNTGGAVSTSGGSDAGGDAGDPNCVTGNGFLCPPDLKGMPFVAFIVWYSDFCGPCSGDPPPLGESTVTLSQPEPGKVCLTGKVSPGGLAGFNLELATRTTTGISEPFNAARLLITQIAFTVDSPPSAGLSMAAAALVQYDCPNDPLACSGPNFSFNTITAAGPLIAPFSDFKSSDPTQVLDTSKLVQVFIQNHQAGDYNFCIHDLKFLDAQGNVVEP
jgi:hypothetical protein